MATAVSPKFRWARLLLPGLSLLACLVFWHWAATSRLDLGLISFVYVPPPGAVAEAAWSLATSPKLLPHLSSSLGRVFAGYFAAVVLGIGIGLFIGRWKVMESLLLPPLEVLRPIPAVAWIPPGDSDVSFVGVVDDFHHVYRGALPYFAQHHPRRGRCG
ncbi:MAG: hypothetical protein NVV73_23165 [Cellvibrionaceae bacterium]|nr:hypothetical protein [Cellvibrionaceae bacterium]